MIEDQGKIGQIEYDEDKKETKMMKVKKTNENKNEELSLFRRLSVSISFRKRLE